jgi:hypothetical protein
MVPILNVQSKNQDVFFINKYIGILWIVNCGREKDFYLKNMRIFGVKKIKCILSENDNILLYKIEEYTTENLSHYWKLFSIQGYVS